MCFSVQGTEVVVMEKIKTERHPYEEDSYEIGWTLNRSYLGKGITDEVAKYLWNMQKKCRVTVASRKTKQAEGPSLPTAAN